MVVGLVSAAEVRLESLRALGLNPAAFSLTTPEAVSSALRWAAGFLCPCSRAALRQAVGDALAPLISAPIDDDIDDLLDALVAHGDLCEFQDPKEHAFLVHTVMPAYVQAPSGAIFLLGVVPDHTSPLPADLERRIECTGHIRRITPGPADDVPGELRRLGLREVSLADWTKSPPQEAASVYVNRFGARLAAATRAGEIPGLTILNPDTPVHFYRGRWITPGGLTGRFVGRRPQRYGAELWCYVELARGAPQRLVELPLAGTGERGCDEAWRLQAAIDADRGQRQQVALRPGRETGTVILACYGPLPQWARRRLDLLGCAATVPGALFAYLLSETDSRNEARFLEELMWVTASGDNPGGRSECS